MIFTPRCPSKKPHFKYLLVAAVCIVHPMQHVQYPEATAVLASENLLSQYSYTSNHNKRTQYLVTHCQCPILIYFHFFLPHYQCCPSRNAPSAKVVAMDDAAKTVLGETRTEYDAHRLKFAKWVIASMILIIAALGGGVWVIYWRDYNFIYGRSAVCEVVRASSTKNGWTVGVREQGNGTRPNVAFLPREYGNTAVVDGCQSFIACGAIALPCRISKDDTQLKFKWKFPLGFVFGCIIIAALALVFILFSYCRYRTYSPYQSDRV